MPALHEALSLEIADDALSATLAVAQGVTTTGRDREAIVAFLREYKLRLTEESLVAVDTLLAAVAAEPGRDHKAIVARGVPARHGEDARLVWSDSIEPPSATSRPRVNDSDLIARIEPPTTGEDGLTVRSEPIPARDGKPISIHHDDSIRTGVNGELIAACAGAVFFENNALRVSNRLDLASPAEAVSFEGDIHIKEGAPDGADVTATGNVFISGLVGAAKINAGVDVRLDGGLAARSRGGVVAERDLRARYLDNALIVIGRHVTVDREIVSCDLTIGGALRCVSGSMIGGTAAVGGVCELAELGSPAALETRLALGELHDFDGLEARLAEVRDALDTARSRVRTEYDQLVAHTTKLTESQADRMTELHFSLATLDGLCDRVIKADERVERVIARHTDAELTIHRMIHPGVTLKLGGFEASFVDPIKGPVRITLHPDGQPHIAELTTDDEKELSEVANVQESAGSVAKAA